MSQAFVKESDEEWLHDISPTLNALQVYLTRQNNGVRVYEKITGITQALAPEIHLMSNGLSYGKDADGRWQIVD